MLVNKDTAYLLHTKPYRENSILAYLFTKQHGKVSVIVNGIKSTKAGKSAKQSSKSALLQPCRPIFISYQLKNGLSKIIDIELKKSNMLPSISHFMLYQYAHELLLTLLPPQHQSVSIFTAYEDFLKQLCNEKPHTALRQLELSVIDYFDGIDSLYSTPTLRNTVNVGVEYSLNHETGINTQSEHLEHSTLINSDCLQAFNHMVTLYHQNKQPVNNSYPHVVDASISETLAKGAQPINTFFIGRLLGGKTLKTRNIYRELQELKIV